MWVCGLKPEYQPLSDYTYSRTLCGCVDWNQSQAKDVYLQKVAPYVGVWIETSSVSAARPWFAVAPYVGVWIETLLQVQVCLV